MTAKRNKKRPARIGTAQSHRMVLPVRNAVIELKDCQDPDTCNTLAQVIWSYIDSFEALLQSSNPQLVEEVMRRVMLREEMARLGHTNTRVLIGVDRLSAYIEKLRDRRKGTRDEMVQDLLGIRIEEARRILRFLETLGDVEREEEVLDVGA